MLIRTPSLVYDDRVRKEAQGLRGMDVYISAFENRKCQLGEAFDGINVYRHSLKSRKFFGSKKLVWIKIIEMYALFLSDYIRIKPRYVWLHNIESMLVVFLVRLASKLIRKDVIVIFDQHELPPEMFLKNKLLQVIYKASLQQSDINAVATEVRGDYINDSLGSNVSFLALENFPDKRFCLEPSRELPPELVDWLKGAQFFLSQGGARADRGFREISEAAMRSEVKVVFVGPVDAVLLEKMSNEFKENFSKWVYVHPPVPQMRLVDFIDAAMCALIFYKNTSMNNWLAAPNRLFQTLARGRPAICGNNPIFLKANNSGVVIANTDGSSVDEIMAAIKYFRNSNVHVESRGSWSWDAMAGKISLALDDV